MLKIEFAFLANLCKTDEDLRTLWSIVAKMPEDDEDFSEFLEIYSERKKLLKEEPDNFMSMRVVDDKVKKWERNEGFLMAMAQLSKAQGYLHDFDYLWKDIKDLKPGSQKYIMAYYHVARHALRRLYTTFLYNQCVEDGVNLPLKELTPEEFEYLREEMFNEVEKWF